jgi:methylmalonyl-CoA/ethylmalonyl-CoA epimerase
MIFHHIGIFTSDLNLGRIKLSSILPIESFSEPIEDPGLKVQIQFCFDSSGICYELVAPFGENNPVSGILLSGKAIINHVAYTVLDIDRASENLRKEGCVPISKARPALAFDNRRVIFFMSPLRFIIELIEAPENLN